VADLPPSTAVTVIGGGAVGACTAYHLASSGIDVTRIERETIGSGSTSKAAGGFRAQFFDDLNIRISLENIRRLVNFEAEFDTDISLRQWGYLFLLKEDEVGPFRRAVDLQQSHGVPTKFLDISAVQELVPGIRTHDLVAATFCPLDGFCTPEAVAYGYARAASKNGAVIVQGCEVIEIVATDSRIKGVRTSAGFISTGEVVLAAGVWSPQLSEPLGIELPLRLEKRHMWLTKGSDPFPPRFPLVIDFATGFHFLREAEGLAIGGREQTLEDLAPIVLNRAPALLDSEITHGWWGYYGMSPDHNAMVGTAEGIERLHYATGFSGHGFQQSPVIGEHLAQLVMGSTPTFDLSRFNALRFRTGEIVPEGAII